MSQSVLNPEFDPPPAPPFRFDWSTADGFRSTDVAVGDGPTAVPREIGTERMSACFLGPGAGLFEHGFRLNRQLSITGTKTSDRGVLVIRAGLTRDALCQRDGLGTVTETVGQYSLLLFREGGKGCTVTYGAGEPSVAVGPILTEEYLRVMLAGYTLPKPIERFLDGRGEDFTAQPRYSVTMCKLVEQIRAAPYQGAMQTLYLQGKVHEMLAEVLAAMDQGHERRFRPVPAECAKVEAACELLERDLFAPPSQEALAAAVGLSSRRLAMLFREVKGMTVVEWVLERKLDQAARLLLDENLAIKQIAFLLGYAHIGNFTAAFARRFGVPPARYRKTVVMKHVVTGESS